jgi:hypothetical protein
MFKQSGGFVEQKLAFSCSFKSDLNRNCQRYDLCHLSWTWMFNKPTSNASDTKPVPVNYVWVLLAEVYCSLPG